MVNNEITELYRKYGYMIYGRCLRILRCEEEARDAMQAVFMQVIEQYTSIRDKSSVVPWIFRTATNYCFNTLRYRRKFSSDVNIDEMGENDAIDDRLSNRQLVSRLMGRVKSKVRDAVYYTFVEELDQRAIQKITGQSPASIRRNLKKFKDSLPSARKELGL